ncbi:MAG: type II toxin-antitoxin system VapC family toxin [Candidatus Omnitrophica bacterium]|nr:type II toxin-antitoxin system VapC family toxin [Candidatus Omnitrophota bacterium]
MLFDTDILIWVMRGNNKAGRLIDNASERQISILTRMELLQGAKNKTHIGHIQSFISEFGFIVLPLTENIGHRAMIYLEEYALSDGLRTSDALIAATAAENGLALCSGNVKHYRPIKDLKFQPFAT